MHIDLCALSSCLTPWSLQSRIPKKPFTLQQWETDFHVAATNRQNRLDPRSVALARNLKVRDLGSEALEASHDQ